MSCEQCFQFFHKKRQPTPCGSCTKPMLDAGNLVEWELFEETATHVRTAGMGGIVGFDYSALPMFLKAYDVPESEWWIVLKKLGLIYSIAVRLWNEQSNKKPPSK